MINKNELTLFIDRFKPIMAELLLFWHEDHQDQLQQLMFMASAVAFCILFGMVWRPALCIGSGQWKPLPKHTLLQQRNF